MIESKFIPLFINVCHKIKSHNGAQQCRYHDHNRTEIVGYQNDSEGRLPPHHIEYKESVPGNLPKQDGGNKQLNGCNDQPVVTLSILICVRYTYFSDFILCYSYIHYCDD